MPRSALAGGNLARLLTRPPPSSQYEAQAQTELETLQAAQAERAAAKAAKHEAMCRDIAWQLVMLAERTAAHRETVGANVPRLEYRRWMAMFTADDPALGEPVTRPEADAATVALQDAAEEHDRQLARSTVGDYLECAGEWARGAEQGGGIGTNAPVGEVSEGGRL